MANGSAARLSLYQPSSSLSGPHSGQRGGHIAAGVVLPNTNTSNPYRDRRAPFLSPRLAAGLDALKDRGSRRSSPFPYSPGPLSGRESLAASLFTPRESHSANLHLKAVLFTALLAVWAVGLCHHFLGRDILGNHGRAIYRLYDFIVEASHIEYVKKVAFMRTEEYLKMTSKQQDDYSVFGFCAYAKFFLFSSGPLLYLWEAWRCSTRRYLSDIRDEAGTDAYIDRLTKGAPSLWFESESYHRNSDNEKKVTHRGRWEVYMKDWKDGSALALALSLLILKKKHPRLVSLKWQWRRSQRPLVKIKLAKALLFRNQKSADIYYEQLAFFTERTKGEDKHHEVTPRFAVDGNHCDHLFTAVQGPRWSGQVQSRGASFLISAFANPVAFWVATLLGLTLPYRMWFESQCGCETLTVVKVIE